MNSLSSDTALPKPGVGHDFIHMLSETVDPGTGSVSLSIAFPTPPGRGISPQYKLLYNSSGAYHLTSAPYGSLNFTPTPSIYGNGGWTDNTPVAKWTESFWQAPDPPESSSYFSAYPGAETYYQGNAVCSFLSNFTVSDFDGSTHNLNLGEITTANQFPNPINATCPAGNGGPPESGDGSMYSEFVNSQTLLSDIANWSSVNQQGSNWTVVANPGTITPFIVTDAAGNKYTFPTGSFYQDSDYVNESYGTMEDRNGNLFSWNGDTLSRNIVPTRPPVEAAGNYSMTIGDIAYTFSGTTSGTSSYQVPIVGGPTITGEQDYKLTCPSTSENWNTVSTGGGTASIELPSNPATSLTYSWGTGGAVPNPFGLINEIIYPSGGWVQYAWTIEPSVPNAGTNQGQWQMASYAGMGSNYTGTDWVQAGEVPFGCVYYYSMPVLQQRTVSYDGSTVAQTQKFQYSTTWATNLNWTSKQTTVTTLDNKTGITTTAVYTYLPATIANQPNTQGQTEAEVPVEALEQFYDGNGTSNLIRTVAKSWYTTDHLASEQTTIENGATATVTYCYSGPVYSEPSGCALTDAQMIQQQSPSGSASTNAAVPLLLEKHEFDYGVNPLTGASPTRKTVYTYQFFHSPTTSTIPTAPWAPIVTPDGSTIAAPDVLAPQVSTQKVYDGNGNLVAETDYGYDEYPLANTTGVVQHDDTNYPSTWTVRGNRTSERKCVTIASNACTSYAFTSYTYDIAGQVQSMTDPKGNVTWYSRNDTFIGSPLTKQSDAYVTKVRRPATSQTHLSSYSYRYADGQLNTATDENNLPTTYSYVDGLNRLTEIVGTVDPSIGVAATTTISYNDAPSVGVSPAVTTSQYLIPSNVFNSSPIWKTSTKIMDGVGQTITTKSSDQDASGGNVEVDTTYDGMGRPWNVSNPYWPGATNATSGTTAFTYDALGRKTSQQNPDGSFKFWCYMGVKSRKQGNCNSLVGSNGSSWVDVQDESGNDWQQITDGLGRLTSVFEPNGASPKPSMETDYTYSAADNLLSVNQKGVSGSTPVSRIFSYDAASELLSSTNPESGQVNYVYDLNGNVTTKTDARSVSVGYVYDALNRVIQKNYSSGDPSACFQYDTPLSSVTDPYPINQLTAEWTVPAGTCPTAGSMVTAIPSTAFTSTTAGAHNVEGYRMGEYQCPNGGNCGTAYPFQYTYDLAGGVTSFTNGLPTATSTTTSPGLVFNAAYDSTERIEQLSVSKQPWTDSGHNVAILQQSDPVNTKNAMGAPPYDAWGHLVNEQASLGSSTASSGLEVLSGYDNRGRVLSEVAGGKSSTAIATGSFGVIAVNGTEQFTQPPATASLVISGAPEGPVTWYPCGNSSCPDPEYDQGTMTITINGNSVQASWGGEMSPGAMAEAVAGAVNVGSSTLGVNAILSGATVWMYANSASTKGSSLALSTSVVDTTPGSVFSSPAFSVAASGATFYGGGVNVYDTGNLTVNITNITSEDAYGNPITTTATSPSVSWTSTSSAASLAPLLVSAINTNNGTNTSGKYVTATLDSTGTEVNLKSVATGSASDNYGIEVNITDTTSANNPLVNPASLPPTSFEFDASSTAGASNGDAATNYATIYSYTVPAGGYALNGNILAHSDSIMGDWAFQYDTLNRLIVAAPAINAPSSYQKTVGCFGYDPFGNRTTEAFLTSGDCTTAGVTARYNSSNKVAFVGQSAPVSYSAAAGFTYDAAGNVTNDGNNTYAYDGDGRLCAVYDGITNQYTRYIYSAAGSRVAKVGLTWLGSGTGISSLATACTAQATNANWTFTPNALFLLDQGGNQVTELTGAGAWKHTNVWAGAHLDATYDSCGLHFHLADPLGTRRVQANGSGQVEESIQSLPFGENLVEIAGSATCEEDATEHHFTGKERDSESGNDYFGARYYASSMGRFMSPDWSAKADPVPYAKLEDPQTLNLYAYVTNNPLAKRDLDGHWMAWQHVDISERAYDRAHIARNQSVINAIRDVDGGGHNPYTGYVIHHGDFGRAQDAPGSQAFHFLRDAGQSQMAGYNASMSRITNEANAAYSALQKGDQAGFANAMGGAGHDIQDSFAHTWRENGTGAITHLECYNCSGSEMDHQHPDYQPVATGGAMGPEAQASVDATSDFFTLMNGASNMTQSQFQSGLQSFESKWFQQKLPQ